MSEQETLTTERLRMYLLSRRIAIRIDRTYTTKIALAKIEELEQAMSFLDQFDGQGMKESAERWRAGFDQAREDFMRAKEYPLTIDE